MLIAYYALPKSIVKSRFEIVTKRNGRTVRQAQLGLVGTFKTWANKCPSKLCKKPPYFQNGSIRNKET